MSAGSVAGDLRVALSREPRILKLRGKETFDWQIVIEAIGGGVRHANGKSWYRAPDSGYMERIEINGKATDQDWSPIQKLDLVGSFRQGRLFSRIELEFRMDSLREETGFTLKLTTNPAGSRNLQP
jgi:hypothetical protein